MTDDQIEQAIQDKGLTAPKVTLQVINDAIVQEVYQRIQATTVTVCVLTLKNGFTVTGHSACVSPENFDDALGEQIAREHAIDQCWRLFGFHLASVLNGSVIE